VFCLPIHFALPFSLVFYECGVSSSRLSASWVFSLSSDLQRRQLFAHVDRDVRCVVLFADSLCLSLLLLLAGLIPVRSQVAPRLCLFSAVVRRNRCVFFFLHPDSSAVVSPQLDADLSGKIVRFFFILLLFLLKAEICLVFLLTIHHPPSRLWVRGKEWISTRSDVALFGTGCRFRCVMPWHWRSLVLAFCWIFSCPRSPSATCHSGTVCAASCLIS